MTRQVEEVRFMGWKFIPQLEIAGRVCAERCKAATILAEILCVKIALQKSVGGKKEIWQAYQIQTTAECAPPRLE